MCNMIYKGIRFDDWQDERDQGGKIWMCMCEYHRKRYSKEISSCTISKAGSYEFCSVFGCDKTDDSVRYVDINDIENVRFEER